MEIIFHDWEEDLKENLVIASKTDLANFIEIQSYKEPFLGQVTSKHAHHLDIGFSFKVFFIQITHVSLEPPYLVATTKNITVDGDFEFMAGGTPTPIENRFCLSKEEAKEIIWCYLETGNRHPDYDWEDM